MSAVTCDHGGCEQCKKDERAAKRQARKWAKEMARNKHLAKLVVEWVGGDVTALLDGAVHGINFPRDINDLTAVLPLDDGTKAYLGGKRVIFVSDEPAKPTDPDKVTVSMNLKTFATLVSRMARNYALLAEAERVAKKRKEEREAKGGRW